MSQTSNSPWPQPPYDTMGTAPDDDFSNLFDLGDIQLDFPSFDAPEQQPSQQQDVDAAMDTSGDMARGGDSAVQHQPWEQNHMSQQTFVTGEDTQYGSAEGLMGMDMQHQPYQHQPTPTQQVMQEHEYHQRHFVPPTPDSIEMRGGTAQYRRMGTQQDASIDRYQQMKDDLMAFTPLVSPAVTPLDTQFQLPEYTVPGAYFSPLTSPALEAQNQSAHPTIYSGTQSYESSMNSSPVDRTINQSMGPNLQAISARKPAKRRTSTTTRNPVRSVRQSPIVKPQRRKGVGLSRQSPMINAEVQKTYSQGSSETGSISPEPLSEALMAPPPAPRQNHAKSNGISHNGPKSAPLLAMGQSNSLCPATPSSLMKLQKQSNGNVPEMHLSAPTIARSIPEEGTPGQPMNDICLPEAAISSRPLPGRLEQDDQTTPTMSAKTTPRLGPSSTSTLSNSAYSSPQLSAISSPNGSISTGRHLELKRPGRGGKRNSVSSVHVSPALRPKISPSIKPLLPEGAVSAETSALLLATKSNYQNILEGTHVPGVSYPANLSTNLTSKRTSHKIAEQGRRNRINNALQEIASLLPTSPGAKDSPTGGAGSGNGSSGGGSEKGAANMVGGQGSSEAQQSNSKAATVEMAIEYIRQLQMELKETKDKLEKVERERGGEKVADAGSGAGTEDKNS